MVESLLVGEPSVSFQSLARLVKLRIGILVLFTAGASYHLAGGMSEAPFSRFLGLLFGTGLICLGAAALNQALELKWDRLMERTRVRPLPAGKISQRTANAIGIALSGLGFGVLWIGVPLLSFALAGLGWLVYLAIYTPLKRRTIACILPGAIAGALPPVIGASAVDDQLHWHAGFLFALFFIWQMPHLLAIAWLHRDDYEVAGFAIPGRGIFRGHTIPGMALFFIIILTMVSLFPYWAAKLGSAYLAAASIPNLLMLFCGIEFLVIPRRETARRLFGASILYLPGLLIALLLNG